MAPQHQSIELERIGQYEHESSPDSATEQQQTRMEIEQASLPPADRGKQAWLVLAGCSLIQIPVWGESLVKHVGERQLTISLGYSLAFGVFQEFYGSHPNEIDGDISNIAVIGTTMTVR